MDGRPIDVPNGKKYYIEYTSVMADAVYVSIIDENILDQVGSM